MDSLSTYEEQIVKRFIEEFGTGKKIQTNYRYLYNDKVYRFDLVELDEQEKIKAIYEIKTPSAVKFIPNSLRKLLQTYKALTAEGTADSVFLVYLDKKLHIVSLSSLAKEKEYVHPIYTIESFSDFYCILK